MKKAEMHTNIFNIIKINELAFGCKFAFVKETNSLHTKLVK